MRSSSVQDLDFWIYKEKFMGWDPFDALNSRFLRRISLDNRLLGQMCVQIIRRFPVNLRPLLGIAKGYNSKGMGLFLSTFSRRFEKWGREDDLKRALFFSEWLRSNTSTEYSGSSWGYNFDWPNRSFYAPAGTPTIVNTAFIGLSFLDLDRALGNRGNPPGYGMATAYNACKFILLHLNRCFENTQEFCFSYTPLDHRCVHNANMMGAWLLSEVWKGTGDVDLAEAAIKAARFTVRHQKKDGSWTYGTESIDSWVDNFHTGYVLTALKSISKNLSVTEFSSKLEIGYEYWKRNFFLSDGTPKYYNNKVYPIDSHCAAQAILTFLAFEEQDPEALEWAIKISNWGINNMQSKKGYFYYQRWPGFINKIPYMRWTQTWMQRALTELSIRLS